MTNLTALIAKLRELESRATPGEVEAFDNYLQVETLDGERGKLLAEFFGANPMHGDNCNDTHFYAELRNALPTLLAALEEARETLERYATREYDSRAEGDGFIQFAASEFLTKYFADAQEKGLK